MTKYHTDFYIGHFNGWLWRVMCAVFAMEDQFEGEEENLK